LRRFTFISTEFTVLIVFFDLRFNNNVIFKAAIKREQSQACLSYAEHEQARPQVNGQWSILGGNPMDWPALSAGYLPSISVASLMQGQVWCKANAEASLLGLC
jgi:hypothetical protein